MTVVAAPLKMFLNRDPTDVERFCMAAEEVAKTTYQRGLGAGFQDGPEARRRLTFLAEKGWMHCSVLYLKDQPVAYIPPVPTWPEPLLS